MVNLPVSLGIGRADLLFPLKICHDLRASDLFSGRYAISPPQLSTEEWNKITMVITLSFLGLEGQSSTALY